MNHGVAILVDNILSIDVEEIFHAEYVRGRVGPIGYRTMDNLPPIVEMLREFDVRATFFMVGELVERFPEALAIIEEEGHEAAFHGWSHVPLWAIDEGSYREGLKRFLRLHPGCLGHRAPSFSLDDRTPWALAALRDEGLIYDSSVFPVKTFLYGVSGAPIWPYRPSLKDLRVEDDSQNKLWEFPLAVKDIFGFRLPAAGGFYLRLCPSMIRSAVEGLNSRGFPAIIFVHSWELDRGTPRLDLGFYRSFVTYRNMVKTEKFLKTLLNRFRFTCFRDYMEVHGLR
jgi:polysaccharide deacetylase family protein (PEP-CTERM system associated)